MVMDEHINNFADWLWGVRQLSHHTINAYVRDLRVMSEYMESASVETITHSDMRSYIMYMRERGDNPRSINRRMSAARTFFDYLISHSLIKVNPTSKIKSLPITESLPKFIDQPRIKELINHLMREDQTVEELQDSCLVLLLYSTGIRRGELAGLDHQSLDLSANTIKVMGKGKKARIIPLLPSVSSIIKQYLSLKSEDKIWNAQNNSLFLTKRGKPIDESYIYGAVHEILSQAGIPGQKSPHILRHTFASHLMQKGVGVRQIQELLGHSSLNSTQIYAHNTIEGLKKEYNLAHPRQRVRNLNNNTIESDPEAEK